MFRFFKAQKIFDPYAGWGDRALASMACNIDYIGIDSNPRLVACYKKFLDFYPHTNQIAVIHDRAENVNIAAMEFDLLFSSPPFYTRNHQLVERYPCCETQMDNFLEHSLKPIMRCALGKKARVCLHLPQNMYEVLALTFGSCQMRCGFRMRPNAMDFFYVWF
jgi:16S rRNA G966 N2-methylase RsmD